MTEITEQLNIVIEQLKLLTNKQAEHENALAYLNGKMNEKSKQTQQPNGNNLDIFKIPDPIKSIPSFDGNKKQVNSWLKTAENTLSIFEPLVTEQQYKIYLQAVVNKIEGKAKDILCLSEIPESFDEIKKILTEALADKQELSYYKSALWGNKQVDNQTIHKYYTTTKGIVQKIKTLAKQNPLYNEAWGPISNFIEEDALAAFISGLKKPYFGYAQAAKPKDIEEAYAFLCKFSTNESISKNLENYNKKEFNSNDKTRKFNNNPNSSQNNQKPNWEMNKNQNQVANPKNSKSFQIRRETPMEVDSTIQSKLQNKNTFNNTEIEENEANEIDDENFSEASTSDTED